jgi:hypothetical protein
MDLAGERTAHVLIHSPPKVQRFHRKGRKERKGSAV